MNVLENKTTRIEIRRIKKVRFNYNKKIWTKNYKQYIKVMVIMCRRRKIDVNKNVFLFGVYNFLFLGG